MNNLNKEETVIAVTKDCEIRGSIMKREGYKGRLSDTINEDKRFINMKNVDIIFNDTTKGKKHLEFLCLNKDSIIMFYPTENQ